MIIEHVKEPTIKKLLEYPLLAKDFSGNVYYMHNRKEGTCVVCASEVNQTKVGKLVYTDAEKLEVLAEDEYIKFIVDK